MRFVVLLSAITMMLEVGIGWYSKSMALLAAGIHMGAHVVVLGLALGAYILVRHLEVKDNSNSDGNKILNLSAYTSGMLLLFFAIFIIQEAVERLSNPAEEIMFTEALIVAIIGLVVNTTCATILHDKHGHDLNNRSAYLHVLSDAFTSMGTIVALFVAKFWSITWVDTLVAVICSLVIMKWAIGLLKKTSKSLTLNAQSSVESRSEEK